MSSPNQSVKKRCIQVSAPGKVILFGEHSVVYNKLAVAASLGLRTRVKLEELDENEKFVFISLPALELQLKYSLNDIKELLKKPLNLTTQISNYNFTTPDLLDYHQQLIEINDFLKKTSQKFTFKEEQGVTALFYLIWAILGTIQFDLKPFRLEITTDLTISAGTGSSASFAVCIAAVLLKFINLQPVKIKNGYKPIDFDCGECKFTLQALDLISKWGFECERILHGTPSGIDNTICTYGSLIEFYRGKQPQRVKITKGFKLILVNTKVARDTKKLVANVAELKQKYPEIIDGMLETMNAIAKKGVETITKINDSDGNDSSNYETLGELTRINQSLLNGLGVGHAKLDQICAILAGHGLWGKLTGAGGGGYAICLVPPEFYERIANVLHDLNAAGFTSVFTDLGGEGVRLDNVE